MHLSPIPRGPWRQASSHVVSIAWQPRHVAPGAHHIVFVVSYLSSQLSEIQLIVLYPLLQSLTLVPGAHSRI